jgi:hypothetical protein
VSRGEQDRPTEALSLKDSTLQMIEEARMVLPGIQALFGFQLIACFNERFEELSRSQQMLHFMALGLVAVSIALVMTPAAYHRIHSPRAVSERLVRLSSVLLLLSMAPLAVAISAEFYLVGRLLFDADWLVGAAMGLFGLFVALWVLLPTVVPRERSPRGHAPAD